MKRIINKLIEVLKEMKGVRISLTQLLNMVYGVNCLTDCEIEGVKINDCTLFDILDLLQKEGKKQRVYLDFSHYYGQCVGIPYNLPFVVKVK